MLPCTASCEAEPAARMASCRISAVDQRFARSSSSTLPPQLGAASASAGDERQQQHVSPFHIGPPADFSSRSTLGANHGLLSASAQQVSDDQPLDLTGGGAARKRRGSGSPNPDADSPLDLSVKRSRTSDAAAPLTGFAVLGVDHAEVGGGGARGLAMCGGGVVGHSPLRSIHVARSPIPLSKLHAAAAAAGHQLPAGDVPRPGAVPVIRRVSSTPLRGSASARGSRTGGGGQPRSSRMISDEERLSSARHARDVTVVVNGHRPEVLVAAKDALPGGQGNVLRPAFTRIDYGGDRRGMGGIFPGRQSYLSKAYDRGSVTILGGRSHIEPLIAASPTSVSSLPVSAAYVTPPPPVRPNAIHCGGSVARRLDPRSKVFPTLQASFPETGGSLLSASHRVTLVDRLDQTDPRLPTTFLPPNVVVSSSQKDADGSGGLYFGGDNQPSTLLIAAENSADQLRGGFAASVWNSLTADVQVDSERTSSTKSSERSSAFSGPSPSANSLSEVGGIADDRSAASGDGASTIVAERNFAVTQMVDFVERQRAPLSAAGSTSGGSLLGHLSSATRLVPVANVHPIMKDATQTAAITASPPSTSTELPAPCRLLPPAANDDACSPLPAAPMSMSSARPLDAPAPAKDMTARLAAGLSREGRVSSHHMEYVKFLRQSVDETAASSASLSVASASPGHPRSVRGQATVEKRRGSGRGGGVACRSGKARRQLLPYYHHDDQATDGHRQTVPDRAAAVAASDGKPASTTDAKNAAVAAVSSSAEEHGSGASLTASSVSTGRKTTPIVYFDDDEPPETPCKSQPATAKHWRQSSAQGAPTARKQPAKQRKNTRGDWNTGVTQTSTAAAAGKQSGTLKRRKRINDAKNDRSNVQTAVDDDLTDFEDALPSTSTQVSRLLLKPTMALCSVTVSSQNHFPAISWTFNNLPGH